MGPQIPCPGPDPAVRGHVRPAIHDDGYLVVLADLAGSSTGAVAHIVSPISRTGSVEGVPDVDRLRRQVAETSDPRAASSLGWLLWRRGIEDEAVEAFALAMTVDVGEIPSPLLPRVADAAADFAAGLLERALVTTDPRVVNLSVELWNRIANIHPDNAGYLSRLGIALRVQFERTGDHDRLALGVRAGERALLLAEDDDPELAAHLCNTAVTLTTLYVHSGDRAELTRAVQLAQEAVAILPTDHPERANYLSTLAGALRLRQADITDVQTAVRAARRAVQIDANGSAALLSDLAINLLTSFRHTGDRDELDEAVDWAGRASTSLPAGHPSRVAVLSNLAAALRSRFEVCGDPADLDGAIRAAGSALRAASLTDPDRSLPRTNLGAALLTRFEITGRIQDLDNALRLLRAAAADTPRAHADRAVRSSYLGLALHALAHRTGSRGHLDEAVQHLRTAATAGRDDPLGPMYLGNLSNALHTRFDWSGSTGDLDEAVVSLSDAVTACPEPHPDRALHLGNLAATLLARFRRRAEPDDLTRAVDVGREALRLTPDGHPSQPLRQTNLGTALRARVALAGPGPGSRTALDEAVALCEAAVAAHPTDAPDHPGLLSNLASTLLTRHRHGGSRDDLTSAVHRLRQAVELTATALPSHGIYLSNLGYALSAAGDHPGASEACLGAAAVRATPPTFRLRAAWHTAELLARTDPARAAMAARLATELLPGAVARELEREDQEDMLSELSGVATDAAALTIAASPDATGNAVEALETGRVVLLSRVGDRHPDLARLRERHPELAARLVATNRLLNAGRSPLDEASGRTPSPPG